MKKHYVFSKGERGKFYQGDGAFDIVIHIDQTSADASSPLRLTRRLRELEKLPEQKRKAILKTLNDLFRANS